MAKFNDIYQKRGIMDALMGISEDTPEMDISNITSVDQLQNALKPSNDQRKMAFWQGLFNAGTAMNQGQGLGAGLAQLGASMQAGKQPNQKILEQIQTRSALQKLLQPDRKAPTTRTVGKMVNDIPYKVDQEFDDQTGQWKEVGTMEQKDWNAPKQYDGFQSQLNDLKLQNLQSQIDARNTIVSDKEAKRKIAEDKNAARATAADIQAENVLNTVGEAKAAVSPWSAGWGSKLSGIPTSDAKDLASKLETVKANLGFDRLQQMRDLSPTGGALGAVAVQELTALQSTVANLDQAQSEDELRKSLDKIENHYKAWQKTVKAGSQVIDNTDDDLINKYLD